jgi:hypothetical protein
VGSKLFKLRATLKITSLKDRDEEYGGNFDLKSKEKIKDMCHILVVCTTLVEGK